MKQTITSTLKGGASKGAKTGTRERILDVALRLFNDTSVSHVTTNHIAEAAGLSVGNLYYHYRNKEEIIRAIFDRHGEETRQAFAVEPETEFSLETFETLLRANQEILWRYRFLYRELVPLLRQDPVLAETYRQRREVGLANTGNLLRAFVASGFLKPIPEDEIDQIVMLIWAISELYAGYVEAGGVPVTEAHLEEVVLHIKRLLEPFRGDR